MWVGRPELGLESHMGIAGALFFSNDFVTDLVLSTFVNATALIHA